MRSSYGRIFAEPTPPDALQARHGDLWVSPVGLQFFSRTPGQVGNPGTGVWTAVTVQPLYNGTVTAANDAVAVAAATLATSGTLTLEGDAVTRTPTSIVISGLSTAIRNAPTASSTVTLVVGTNTSALVIGAATATAAGQITIAITSGTIAPGTSVVLSFYAVN